MSRIHRRRLVHLLPAPADLPRRDFVRRLVAGSAALGTLGLAGCGGGGDDAPAVRYAHGVASGDPLADRVVLWTRLSTEADAVEGQWAVAEDEAFSRVVARGSFRTDRARDHTVKVEAGGLRPGSRYVYRFAVGGQVSPAGRTRTLPAAGVREVKLAVFSCSNYPAGYFNVYAHAAERSDLDATVHLGDYLYEYGRDGYASADAAALGRLSEPAGEILSLADYRRRHAQYRSDADLQRLHAAAPMIAVWDDHEIANDTWREGAENHDPATEGDFAARRAAALQAYHEWMPTRVAAPDTIDRSFDFGELLSLHMLDTRVVARDEPLDYADFLGPAGLDAAAFSAAVGAPGRALLGSAQTARLQQRLEASRATWQVLGQQVLMARMNIPAPILFDALNPGSGLSVSAYAALVAKARSAPETLSPQEQALLAQPALPYNLDAWDGYAAARETVLGLARSLDKNLVVLAGDTHNAWASDLRDAGGRTVGVEFATASVSSPGFETIFPNDDPAVLAASLTELIEPLVYCDTARRGYLLLTARPEACRADWVYVDTVVSRSYSAAVGRSLQVLPGAGGRRIVEIDSGA